MPARKIFIQPIHSCTLQDLCMIIVPFVVICLRLKCR
jgi:hypothetical protein